MKTNNDHISDVINEKCFAIIVYWIRLHFFPDFPLESNAQTDFAEVDVQSKRNSNIFTNLTFH